MQNKRLREAGKQKARKPRSNSEIFQEKANIHIMETMSNGE
jgi:hypothetical protein